MKADGNSMEYAIRLLPGKYRIGKCCNDVDFVAKNDVMCEYLWVKKKLSRHIVYVAFVQVLVSFVHKQKGQAEAKGGRSEARRWDMQDGSV